MLLLLLSETGNRGSHLGSIYWSRAKPSAEASAKTIVKLQRWYIQDVSKTGEECDVKCEKRGSALLMDGWMDVCQTEG